MKEKETYDVSEVNIEELHPEIYNKLVDTCDSVAWDVALAEAARDAHYYDEDHTFLDKLQEYCESEYNYDESQKDFRRWFTLLIRSWSRSQICDLYNQAGIELCWDVLEFDGIETYDYEVTLPQSIVSMVFDVWCYIKYKNLNDIFSSFLKMQSGKKNERFGGGISC